MLPKLVDLPVKPFGFYPDAVPSESFFWKDAQNVEFSGGHPGALGHLRFPPASLRSVASERFGLKPERKTYTSEP